ncbi:TVP38/TMEM64 family protein [Roseiterribacter gracilis]|uniref:TVP38/TMEM64 family membrane protein n=1 Tax=Roseiterribacter gracilis TaxID=2812848 RepID=A0A8S8XEG7_9PROT|nr:hypothetical protein TMPK1_19030 [Rhodospirillales bacterium TMPK1]
MTPPRKSRGAQILLWAFIALNVALTFAPLFGGHLSQLRDELARQGGFALPVACFLFLFFGSLTGVPQVVSVAMIGSVLPIVPGFIVCWLATMSSASIGFAIGHRARDMTDDFFARQGWAARRLDMARRTFAENGVIASLLVRFVPIAPFSVVNAMAGALGVRWGEFLLGSGLGICPKVAITLLFGGSLRDVVQTHSLGSLYIVASTIASMVVFAVVGQILFKRMQKRSESSTEQS